MVKYIVILSIAATTVCLWVLPGCLQKLEYPPKFKKDALPDTTPIKIFKNGYRTFCLDSLIEDKDNQVSNLRWSISAGPLLIIRLKNDSSLGRLAELEPVRNQTGNTFVTFTVANPGGLSASKTCAVSIDEPDFTWLIDTINIKKGNSITLRKDGLVKYPSGFNNLQWHTVYVDSLYLTAYPLTTSPKRIDSVKLVAKNRAGTTGVYFQLTDTVNHIEFHQSSRVNIN